MTCRELIGFIHDYLSGDLAHDVREEFDRHLAECPPCIAFLESYRETVRLEKEVYSTPDGDVPGDLPEEVVQAILAAARITRRGS